MKKLVMILVILSFAVINAQSGLQKITGDLDVKIKNSPSDSDVLIWVFFKDKGNVNSQLSKPATSVVSEKSLSRRSKMQKANALIDETDLPVKQSYIGQLSAAGFKVKQVSKWLNGVSGYIKKSRVSQISALDFVNSLDIVYQFKKGKEFQSTSLNSSTGKTTQQEGITALDYGTSLKQNQLMNVPAVHNMGITGQGVLVGIFDAGFTNLNHEVFSTLNIVARYDFVNNRVYVGDGNGGMGSGTHGTETLSCLAGYKPGKLIGPAYSAKFVLAKTENTESETPIEEDNWIRAIEWADSIGIDVASTSLGYIGFDAPYVSYTWQSMDGKTCRITKAADLAFQKGIVVLNSAGNENYDANHNTLGAPSDGFNVIAVGAVDASGKRSDFSSVGNTVDGRIKPDIMAMGSYVTVADPYSNTGYIYSNGTSFSCPLAAGVAALILSAKPSATAVQVRDALRNTASMHLSPGREYGWGIIDALAAINSADLPVELAAFNANINGNSVNLAWKTVSEKNNLGFEIQRGIIYNNDKSNVAWITVGFVKGNGTTLEEQNYSFTEKLETPGKYCYRLMQRDFDGKTEYSNVIYVDYPEPDNMVLNQNYPNPFNPETTIGFSIPQKANVKLSVFNILGSEVSVLYNGSLEKGIYNFKFNGSNFSSGAYFVRLTDGVYNLTKKVLLLK